MVQISVFTNDDEYEGSWKTYPGGFGVSLVSLDMSDSTLLSFFLVLFSARHPEKQTDNDRRAQQKLHEPHNHIKPKGKTTGALSSQQGSAERCGLDLGVRKPCP